MGKQPVIMANAKNGPARPLGAAGRLRVFSDRHHPARKAAHLVTRVALYVFLIDVAFVFLYPFFFMLVNSLKSPNDLMNTAVNWVPTSFHYQNYILAFKRLNYLPNAALTALMTALATLGHILSASFIGYGFARTEAPGKKLFLLILLLSIVLPTQVLSVPLFNQFSTLHMNNSILPMVIPAFFGFGLRGGIFIFIFRQYYTTLPAELEDAAYIDGCGALRTYQLIIMPLSRTMILVSGIISMVWHWNDYVEPALYYMNSTKAQPLSMVLVKLREASKTAFQSLDALVKGEAITQGVLLAAIVMTMIPVLIVYLVLQRRFISGIEHTGLVE